MTVSLKWYGPFPKKRKRAVFPCGNGSFFTFLPAYREALSPTLPLSSRLSMSLIRSLTVDIRSEPSDRIPLSSDDTAEGRSEETWEDIRDPVEEVWDGEEDEPTLPSSPQEVMASMQQQADRKKVILRLLIKVSFLSHP